MNLNVTIYNDVEEWFHAYGNDAVVLHNILDYKIFHPYANVKAVGFPTRLLTKVKRQLIKYSVGLKINNEIIYNPVNSQYEKYLEQSVHQKETLCGLFPKKSGVIRIIAGTFEIKYSDDNVSQKFEIGKNINPKADLIKFVYKNNVGESHKYNDYELKIINKDLKIIDLKEKCENGKMIFKYGKYEI